VRGGCTISSIPEWRYINVRRLFIFIEDPDRPQQTERYPYPPVNAAQALLGHKSLRSAQIYIRAAGHHVHQAAHVLPVRQQFAESAAMVGHRPAEA
jgi:hypothetical protein